MGFLSLIPKHPNGALLGTKLTALWWQTFIMKFPNFVLNKNQTKLGVSVRMLSYLIIFQNSPFFQKHRCG